MKKHKLLITLLAFFAFAKGAWAQCTVMTVEALYDAVRTSQTVKLGNDFTLDNGRLNIDGTTVTLDLNGHTLTRSMAAADAGGQVIAVMNSGKLTITDNGTGGTITGGWANQGGGIYVSAGSELTISGGTITGNTAVQFGGGIHNEGTLTMSGGSITNNTSGQYGGGIYSNSTVTISGASISGNTAQSGGGAICSEGNLTLDGVTITGNSTPNYGGGIYMFKSETSPGTVQLQGECTITGNTASYGNDVYQNQNATFNIQDRPVVDDLYLTFNTFITLTGPLTTGASIGLNAENVEQTHLTLHYPIYHAGTDPNTYFSSNNEFYVVCLRPDGEVIYGIEYIERAWNATENRVEQTTKVCGSYTAINGNDTSDNGWVGLNDGWYVVTGNSAYKTLNVLGTDVHLVIPNGITLTLTGGVKLLSGHKLSIYSQSGDGGQLVVTNSYSGAAGIGGDENNDAGLLEVYGGIVNAKGGRLAAGIGGGENHGFSTTLVNGGLFVYGGTVTAEGGDSAAGIGSGNKASEWAGYVIIYGGTVTAIAGHNITDDADEYAAGIGGGNQGDGAIVHIYGGTVNATGRKYAAAIGGGTAGNGIQTYIDGGNVTAVGGIGGGSGTGASGKGNGGIIEIYDGTVNASVPGYDDGAAIGCGYRGESATISISGGTVNASVNGRLSAAIGGGGGYNPTLSITISGGTVTATTEYGAHGIGAGCSDSYSEYDYQGTFSITGGTVRAKGATRAIGGTNAANLMNLYDGAMVKAGETADEAVLFSAGERVPACVWRKYAAIEPCTHSGATYEGSENAVGVSCPYCHTTSSPFTFQTAGQWNDQSNWLGYLMPSAGKDVAVKAAATIPNGYCAHVGHIDLLLEDGSITIADGGQLIHSNDNVKATVQKHIVGYGTSEGGYRLITNPSMTTQNPETLEMTSGNYDLYWFDQSQELEWQNYKQNVFNLENGKGYLYANSADTDLEVSGVLNRANADINVPVTYNANAAFAGFNLVGNPFVCDAYLSDGRDFYVLNESGDDLVTATSNVIAPMQGVFVQAAEGEDTIAFTTHQDQAQAPQATQRQGVVLEVSKVQPQPPQAPWRGDVVFDRAIVRFGEGGEERHRNLEKYQLNPNHSKIYIPQDGKDYAVVVVASDSEATQGEIPVNFRAETNGTYTLTVTKSLNSIFSILNYLHLIDNMTGADVDLLQTPTYTFDSKVTDYESRFKLVFELNENGQDNQNNSANDDNFAYISNGELVVTGEGTLQVIDALGRNLPPFTSHLSPGIYVLRLINGDDVKTQKIVIK